jgi:hypothetical protein
MINAQQTLAEALEREALKYMDCGLLDEAAACAAVVELIENTPALWCPVNFQHFDGQL